MRIRGRRGFIAFVITFGSLLVALAVALNVGWILLNWRQVALLVLGAVFFVAIIAGLILNTVFLVREIRRNEQHDAFINAVTHELKTPIASINLYLETLKSRQLDESKRQEFYDIMLADTSRLLATIEQVLRAGRTGFGRRRLSTSRIDLAEIARECVDLARTRYGLDDGALRYTELFDEGDPVTVEGDADELRAAISNLIDNAVKYSGKNVDVSVELSPLDATHLALRVRDAGVGIAPSQLKRIFKRFYRVPALSRSNVKGTGLGLFIVKSIVSIHGGRVFADSGGEGTGATFTIELPRT